MTVAPAVAAAPYLLSQEMPSLPPSGSAQLVRATRDSRAPQHAEPKRVRRRGQRLAHKLEDLRAQVAHMERVALALPLIDSDDHVWDEFLDDDTKRVRVLLRQLSPTTKAIRALHIRNAQLQRLLDEHQLAARALQQIIHGESSQSVDTWELDVQRWKALARIHFTPWTSDECAAEIEAAIQDSYRFTYAPGKYSTGLNFMGWEDTLRVLRDGSAFQFSLHKTFRGYDLDHHLDSIARIYQDTKLYTRVLLGDHARTSVDVLQQLSSHVAIVMYHERYEGSDYTVHALNLIARVETEDGVTQYMRSIHAPEVARAFLGPRDTWVDKFYWMQFDRLDHKQPRSSCDYLASTHGTVEGQDAVLLRFWLFGVLGALIRIEALAARHELLAF